MGFILPQCSKHSSRRWRDCHEKKHTNNPTLEGQGVGMRAGHMAVGLGEVKRLLSIPQGKTPVVRAALSDELSQLLFLTWLECLPNKEG